MGVRRLGLLVAVVALIGGLAYGFAWLNGARTYEAIEQGSSSSTPSGAREVPDGRKFLDYRSGRRTTFGFSIANRGDRTVRVLDVRPPSDRVRFQIIERRLSRDFAPRRGRPFEAFDLAPDEDRYLSATVRLGPCAALGRSAQIPVRSVDVRYRTLFFEREKSIRIGIPFRVVKRGRCRDQ